MPRFFVATTMRNLLLLPATSSSLTTKTMGFRSNPDSQQRQQNTITTGAKEKSNQPWPLLGEEKQGTEGGTTKGVELNKDPVLWFH